MEQLYTIGELIHHISNGYQNPKALVTFTEDRWESVSTQEFMEQVKYVALGLIQLGVKRGEKVGIFAYPCGRWTIVDLAIMAIGAVSVPLFPNLSDDSFLFEVKQTELKTVFINGMDEWRRAKETPGMFQNFISLDDYKDNPQAFTYKEFIEQGTRYEKEHPHEYEKILASLKPDDLATIIYTSGSTGVPKGAEHTHSSICSIIHSDIFDWYGAKDRFLSFLPLAHVFARTLNITMFSWGISVYYYNDVKTISQAFQHVKPTLVIVVPRVLEKIHAQMHAKLHAASFIKRIIGTWAFKLASLEKPSYFQRLQMRLADRLVYQKLRHALGGHLRVIMCGGATLNKAIGHFFVNAGFPVYEGWGMTESCPVTVNRIGRNKVGTVGKPIPGMEVTTTEEGELLITGGMMMRGYFRNPEATKATFDAKNRLRTGDRGSIDKDHYVTILGRIKELYKTSTGEMIAPVPIEMALNKIPYVETSIVIGDNRKFISCLFVPDFDAIKILKKKKNLTHLSDMEFLQNPIVTNEINQFIEDINLHLNSWEKIRQFRFIPEPLSVISGELTPSMKVRREIVEKKYKHLIDSMYAEEN